MDERVSLKFSVDGSPLGDIALAFQGRLREVADARADRIAKAYTDAMRLGVVEPGKASLRADIVAGGFYRAAALSKTWRGMAYPSGKPTLEPAGWFINRSPLIIEVFDTGVTIQVSGAHYLAIPVGPAKAIVHRLNRAGNRSRNGFGRFAREDNPVARVEAALGTRLIAIVDKTANRGVLVAENAVRLTRGGHAAKLQNGDNTPLFALAKHATLKRRMRGRELLAEIEAGFEGRFAAAVVAQLGPEDRA